MLTGLYNRTYFEEELHRLEKSRQFPVSIITVRIDNLTAVNSEEGSLAGNELLRQTANILKIFRTEDVLARIGGDTFAAVMPKTTKLIGEKTVERIRASLHAHNKKYTDIPLDLSIGIASGKKGDVLFDILENAEIKMRKILNR